VFHAIWRKKKLFFGPGGVANPRDTTSVSLRFAPGQNPKPLFFICASQRKTLH
jgi:hypothetical protein